MFVWHTIFTTSVMIISDFPFHSNSQELWILYIWLTWNCNIFGQDSLIFTSRESITVSYLRERGKTNVNLIRVHSKMFFYRWFWKYFHINQHWTNWALLYKSYFGHFFQPNPINIIQNLLWLLYCFWEKSTSSSYK